MTTNRDRALDAAIELLASDGIRALTHLRVDDRASLPRGSTSNVFRTREALLVGVARHMAARESPLLATGLAVHTAAELVDALVEIFQFMVGPNRAMTAARLALFVEAQHDDQVREALVEGRASIDRIVRPALAAIGAPDPAFATELIAVCFEGLFLHVIARRADLDPHPHIAAAVTAGLRAD